ncbi:MAG: AMP-binding protein [Gammaproteobacteria bacterium]|nr:AMP-binding protein [Gammaproteobacteria bacterium]
MKTVRTLIDDAAARYGEKTFLITPESGATVSYAELQAQCRLVGGLLDALQIDKGERVAMLMPNGYWSALVFLGVMYSGRVIIPLNAVSGDSALHYVLEHSDSRLILVEQSYRGKFSAVLDALPDTVRQFDLDLDQGADFPTTDNQPAGLQPIAEDDTALQIYTSGTTGKPKGVLLTHRNVIAGGKNTALAHELSAEDRAMCVLPLYHINAEMVTIMAPLVSGGSVVLPYRFSTSVFWQMIAEHACTWFSVVPTIIAYLLEHAEREGFDREALGGLSQLRFGRSASAPLAPEIHRRFENMFGVPVIETMGLSETAAQILSNPMPPGKPKYGSPGIPFGNEAKIIDENGKACADGVEGELMIRGDNVTKGYYKNPQATAEALTADGWLHTGDLAMRDADGFYFITGRLKELIIKGGENIAPREIDEALYEHPAVLEAAGFAVLDERYGQEVMACVALKPGLECNEAELSALLEQKLGRFKCPQRIYFLDELPKGPSGKIQRLKLPALLAANEEKNNAI